MEGRVVLFTSSSMASKGNTVDWLHIAPLGAFLNTSSLESSWSAWTPLSCCSWECAVTGWFVFYVLFTCARMAAVYMFSFLAAPLHFFHHRQQGFRETDSLVCLHWQLHAVVSCSNFLPGCFVSQSAFSLHHALCTLLRVQYPGICRNFYFSVLSMCQAEGEGSALHCVPPQTPAVAGTWSGWSQMLGTPAGSSPAGERNWTPWVIMSYPPRLSISRQVIPNRAETQLQAVQCESWAFWDALLCQMPIPYLVYFRCY